MTYFTSLQTTTIHDIASSLNYITESALELAVLKCDNMPRTKDLMYFLGAAELLSFEILMPSSYFSPKASMSFHSRRLFCTDSGHYNIVVPVYITLS